MTDLHPRVLQAAEGTWPDWAVVPSDARRKHVEGVVECLDRWGRDLGLPDRDRARWRAAGLLHDALRDADPRSFDPAVAPGWPAKLRHGPAVAARLAGEGVDDAELLNAIAYHTTGHPGLSTLGRFLYLADFLEPSRSFLPDWRAALRARLPEEAEAVLREVAAARIARLVRDGRPLLQETTEFWNALIRSSRRGGRGGRGGRGEGSG